MKRKVHARVIVAMITPFDADHAVDYASASALGRYLVDSGADGILVSGTTGESPTLQDEEKLKLLETVLDEVGDEAEVWVGTGTNDTAPTVALTRRAAEAGAHGVMLVTPYYNKPPQHGLRAHFEEAAGACELPVMLYNVPSRTGVDLAPETIARLAEIDNVVAVKEAAGDVNRVAHIRQLAGDKLLIYSGDDPLTLPMLSVGAWGVVSVAAHLVAGGIARMINAYTEGNVQEARDLHARLLPLFEAMFVSTNPIPVKTSVEMIGRGRAVFRPPLVALERPKKDYLEKVLRSLQLLD